MSVLRIPVADMLRMTSKQIATLRGRQEATPPRKAAKAPSRIDPRTGRPRVQRDKRTGKG